DVGMPALEKERAITPRHSPVGMPCGISDRIRLGLDDTPAEDAFGQFPHHQLANQIACERDGIGRQLHAGERRMVVVVAARLQGIRSTHCAREGPGSNGLAKYWVSRATFPSMNSMMLTV